MLSGTGSASFRVASQSTLPNQPSPQAPQLHCGCKCYGKPGGLAAVATCTVGEESGKTTAHVCAHDQFRVTGGVADHDRSAFPSTLDVGESALVDCVSYGKICYLRMCVELHVLSCSSLMMFLISA